jgi:hypothetical protein
MRVNAAHFSTVNKQTRSTSYSCREHGAAVPNPLATLIGSKKYDDFSNVHLNLLFGSLVVMSLDEGPAQPDDLYGCVPWLSLADKDLTRLLAGYHACAGWA